MPKRKARSPKFALWLTDAALFKAVKARAKRDGLTLTQAAEQSMRAYLTYQRVGEPPPDVREFYPRQKAVADSAKRMITKHEKSLTKLAAPSRYEHINVDAIDVEVFGPPINSAIRVCRRTGCHHAHDVHHPHPKSGQLVCGVAGCNCPRYMI